MQIIESYLTNNPCYKSGKSITVKGLMLHSVGCNQPKASVFVKNWNRTDAEKVCVHAFIDAETGDVYQTLPWTMRGWHCGTGSKGSANGTHIGVEMCEPNYIKYTNGASFKVTNKEKAVEMANRTYESAVELFAKLCKDYNLNPLADGVIISHNEGNKRGIATNHVDPEHLWSGLGLDYTMDGFRKDVADRVNNVVVEKKPEADTIPSPEKKTNGDIEYLVRVSIDNLNIRLGPGTNYKTTGRYTGAGVFTIVETVGSWGKLKSGAGWISLNYAKRIK